jgi:molecular chaperone DnaJ
VSDVGSNPGDLVIKISVKPDPYFRRDGFDINTDANISIS